MILDKSHEHMQNNSTFLRASQEGVSIIREARSQKGWTRNVTKNDAPLLIASNFLESDKIYPIEGHHNEIYADGINEISWKRFLGGKQAIRAKVFVAYCHALEIVWEQVVDWDCFDGQLPLFITQ
jgi:hypothetical protein